MEKKIDFTQFFAGCKNEKEVESVMSELLKKMLEDGAKYTKSAKKGTVKAASGTKKGAKAEEVSSTNGAETAEEKTRKRVELIKSAKYGTVANVDFYDWKTKQTKKVSVNIPTKAEIKKLGLKVESYSDKSYVVIGNCQTISLYMSRILGGLYKNNLSCGKGWIFAKNEHGKAALKALSLSV